MEDLATEDFRLRLILILILFRVKGENSAPTVSIGMFPSSALFIWAGFLSFLGELESDELESDPYGS
jgi:hypothetical protein